MKARTAVITVLLFSLLGGAVALGVSECASRIDEKGVPDVATIEIKEYQGENLSSINDFRDNSIAGPQYIDKEKYRLTIKGLVNNPRSLTYNEVIEQHQSQQKVITLDCVEGWSVTILWEGIYIKDLLQSAGVKPEAKVVILRSYDGYSTALPLDYVIDKNIILAYKMNGVTIPPERGFPFQVVAESKWGYKWAKWVTEIELSNDTNYRGYWEERGYSNDGDLDKEFFEPQ
ncbi:MAG TPA: molybdopterin-dependent oxidoreductase [Dehalococcoidales bacterium]